MPQKMEAEILFLDPANVDLGVVALAERDFAVQVSDWVDPFGPTIWVTASITTDLTEGEFFDWVARLVAPLGGDVVEAGLADPSQRAA
jgi:hypothetical protein